MPDKKVAEFLEVQTWFVIRSKSASKSDSKFYVVMSPKETIDFLKAHLTKYAPDVASAASAEPDSGLESVTAVESDTQPRG